MAEVQLQAYGDSRDSYGSIVAESVDYTVDKNVLTIHDDATDIRQVIRALKRLRSVASNGEFERRYSVDLDGSTEYLANTTASTLGITDTWSAVLNVRADAPDSAVQYFLTLKPAAADTSRIQLLTAPTSGFFRVALWDSSQSQYKLLDYDLWPAAGNAHIIVTYDGSDTGDPIVVYSSAAVVAAEGGGTDNTGTQTDASRNVTIGAFQGGSSFLDGAIQDVALFDSLLDSDDATTLYAQRNDANPYKDYSPVHWWSPQLGGKYFEDIFDDRGSGSINVFKAAVGISSADVIIGNLNP